LCNPMTKMKMMMIIFCPFPSNRAPVEWNWQGKTEVLGEKPAPVPLCPPQIPYGLTRDRTRACAVGGRPLTAWAMARTKHMDYYWFKKSHSVYTTRQGCPTFSWQSTTTGTAGWFADRSVNIAISSIHKAQIFV
jgi:hypothetical protein